MFETVEVNPRNPATGTVIWLHGLGADGHDFEPLVPELRLDDEVALRFVFPHAPVRPVTLNGGIPMRAWFDLYQLDRDARVDIDGVDAARREVRALVEREVARGIPTSRIAIAGFSQGGSLALATALDYPEPLAAIIALSAWLPKPYARVADAQRATPILLAHGSEDPVVAVQCGRETHTLLAAAGCRVEWREYLMAHQVCGAEVADIRAFLLKAFNAV